MSRRSWIVLLVLYGLIALAVPLVGYTLPPCFGDASGQISAACLARWEASMPLFPQRFVELLGAPASVVVTFLVLTGTTLAFTATRTFRRQPDA